MARPLSETIVGCAHAGLVADRSGCDRRRRWRTPRACNSCSIRSSSASRRSPRRGRRRHPGTAGPAPILASSVYTRAASLSAPLTMRMFVIWLPRWKWSSLRQSCMPRDLSSSRPRMISVTVRPNLERKPPDDCHRPLPLAASLTRTPICGRTPSFSAASRIRPSSVYFSTTGMMLRPILSASIAVSMNSASLNPLQMMGVSLSAMATTASSSGLEPASRPNLYGRPKSSTSSTTCRCWLTLIG